MNLVFGSNGSALFRPHWESANVGSSSCQVYDVTSLDLSLSSIWTLASLQRDSSREWWAGEEACRILWRLSSSHSKYRPIQSTLITGTSCCSCVTFRWELLYQSRVSEILSFNLLFSPYITVYNRWDFSIYGNVPDLIMSPEQRE